MSKWISSILFVLLSILMSISHADSLSNANTAVLLDIKGGIGPAVQEYIEQGYDQADARAANLVILQIDTPGGLSKSMRGIIKVMLTSPIPTVVYVAPSGARAASAGTYILYAANIAAMAPGTNLGAATPVNMMGGNKKDKANKPSASQIKALNDARAYIRSLAQLRGRNAKWAELAVKKGQSLSATEALKMNVINVVAPNVKGLLAAINGKTVMQGPHKVVLDTNNMVVVALHPNWRAKLLAVITDPSIAYIFLIIAFYGLFFEFAHPGFIVPGVLGGIALLLGLYGLQLLPVNYVGLGLIILGFAFFIGEAFVPSFGMLGIGGIICFIIGSVMLLDTEAVGFTIPWQLITAVSVVTVFFVLGLVQLVFRVRRRPKTSGNAVLIGQVGEVWLDQQCTWLRVNGELWEIINADNLRQGQRAEVIKVEGLKVIIEVQDTKEKKS